MDELESVPEATWQSFTSGCDFVSSFSCALVCDRTVDVGLLQALECSVPPKESKNRRNPARLYKVDSDNRMKYKMSHENLA